MADFQKSFDKVIGKWEGICLENVSGDLGGLTCCGIARNIHPEWSGWSKIDAMKTDGAIDIQKAMPEVMSFYMSLYHPLELLNSQKIADQVWQAAVNCGHIAYKWAQKIVGAGIDGIVGAETVNAINLFKDEESFVKQFYESQIQYYDAIVKNHPDQQKFLAGWHKRAADFL